MIKSSIFWVGLAALLIVSVSFAIAIVKPSESHTWADPDDAKLVRAGERIYLENCASCHGESLEGEPNWRVRGDDGLLPAPPHDESGHTWHHPDYVLFEIVQDGVGEAAGLDNYETNMPAFGDALSEDDIWAVLAFIKSTWPEHIRNRQLEIQSREGN